MSADGIHPTAVVDPKAIVAPSAKVGAFSVIGPEVTIAADAEIGHHCVLEGRVEIGERATIGGLVGMVPFTRIGVYAYVGGCSKVVHDVPPFVLVDGNPAGAHAINVVGLRRAGMKPADRRLLQDAFRLLYRSGLATPRAVERIREELPVSGPVAELLEFIAGSRRGICGPAQPGTSAVDALPSPESEPV